MFIKSLIIHALVILPLQVKAQNFDPGIFRILQEMNIKSASESQDYTCHDAVKNEIIDPKNLQDCAIALCGLPDNKEDTDLTNINFQRRLNKINIKEIEKHSPKLNKLLDKIQKNNLTLLKELENQLTKEKKFIVKPETWSSEFKVDLSKKIFQPYMDIIVNLKKPINDRLQVKIIPPKDASPEFIEQLKSYAKHYEIFSRNNEKSFSALGIYSEEEINLLARKRLDKLNEIYAKSMATFSNEEQKTFSEKIKSAYNNYESLQQNLKLKLTDPDQVTVFSTKVTLPFLEIEELEKIMSGKVADYKQFIHSPSCEKEKECARIFQSFIDQQNFVAKIPQFKNAVLNPKNREKSFKSCKANIIALNIQDADNLSALELSNDVKKQFELNVLPKFSAHSRNIIQDYLNNKLKLTVKAPEEKIQMATLYGKLIDKKIKEVKPDSKLTQELAIGLMLDFSKDNFNIYSSGEIDPCSNQFTTTIWDEYSSESNEIKISDFSCRHQLTGKSIIAHELGHALSFIFFGNNLSKESLELYKSMRQCATDNHITTLPVEYSSLFPEDALMTEEDTADIISNMAYPDKSTLTACVFLKKSANSATYTDIHMNINFQDPHSPNMYRLIMEAINKDVSIPISCQRVMNSLKDKFRFKKCVL